MTRVKRGASAHKKREKVLKQTKGFRWGRKSKEKAAKEALLHAGAHAYRGRKQKKRDKRQLWEVKINAASRTEGISYSKLISALKKREVILNRKSLAELAEREPEAFKKVVAEAHKKAQSVKLKAKNSGQQLAKFEALNPKSETNSKY